MSSLLWDVTQRRFAISYRRFWTAYWSYLQVLRRSTNYQQTSRDNPEEWRPKNIVHLTASVNKAKRQCPIFHFSQRMVSTQHGKPSLSHKTENTAQMNYMTARATRRLDRHVANICHAFSVAPFSYTTNCCWLSFGFSFQTHFISTHNNKPSVVLTNICNKRQDSSFSIYMYILHYGRVDVWDMLQGWKGREISVTF
jgi:hypothetical protein